MTDTNRPKNGAFRQARYRKAQAKLGRKRIEMFLTDEEKAAVDKLLKEARKHD
jgi:hypothetical protein